MEGKNNMGFYATNFVYDGVSSSTYGLRISSLGGDTEHPGADVELITQSVYRRPANYLLGVRQSPPLTIPVTITVETELSATESSRISRWLFGREDYKKLQIIQPDMQYIYYNCVFTNPTLIRYGGIIRGYNANIVCDSPFAWEFPSRISYTYDTYMVNQNITINNTSDVVDYIYPIIEFQSNAFGGYLEIINKSDNRRLFSITGLNPLKYYRVDNNIQTATELTSGENYVPNMKGNNYKWFRYINGINNLNITGTINYISFINHFPKKVS